MVQVLGVVGLRLKGKETRSGVLTCHSCTLRRDVAIKLISQPEVALLFRMHHPNIITFVAACKQPPAFCIIPEYLAGGSIRKYLHQQEPHSVPLGLVMKLALNIAGGMQYLHQRPHFDEIGYAESLEQDPDFFSSYKPPQNHALLRCFPKWKGRHRSAS